MSSEALLAAARASPEAVAAHDKAAWLGLFAADGLVNDPVGSRPHVGGAALERFYETFIAPNDIRFEVEHELVCGTTVVRDAVIEIRMATGLRVVVPAHLRYECVYAGPWWRIQGLYAHWELLPMVAQTLRGLRGWRTQALLGARMLSRQGPAGVFGFSRAFLGVGRAGKKRAEAFLAAMAGGVGDAAAAMLADGGTIELPAGTALDPATAAERLRGLEWHKLLAAGRTVTATVSRPGARGVALLAFGRDRRIERAVFYFPDDP